MNRVQKVEEAVRARYAARNPNRADWADWLGANHVFTVADNATTLASRFGGNNDLARAAALLHDIADTEMSRFAEEHEEKSLEIARNILESCGFVQEEIQLIVDDAIRFHSCYDGITPTSLEGEILATADSQAHLNTDFYVFVTWAMAKQKDLDDVKAWVLKKIDRDFNDKILFPEIKIACEPDYKLLKKLYSR